MTRRTECLSRTVTGVMYLVYVFGVCECSAFCVDLCGWQCISYILCGCMCLLGMHAQPISWLDLGTRTSHNPTSVGLLDSAASSSEKWSETWEIQL